MFGKDHRPNPVVNLIKKMEKGHFDTPVFCKIGIEKLSPTSKSGFLMLWGVGPDVWVVDVRAVLAAPAEHMLAQRNSFTASNDELNMSDVA